MTHYSNEGTQIRLLRNLYCTSKPWSILPSFLLLFFCFLQLPLSAQEETETIYKAKRYLDLKIRAKEKLNEKVNKRQQRTLGRLKKKEIKIPQKLKHSDSLAYLQYIKNDVTFDSISRMSGNGTITGSNSRNINRSIDSLKGVKKFLEDKAHITGEGKPLTAGYDDKLNTLKKDAAHNQEVKGLMAQRLDALNSIKTKNGKTVPGLKSLQKQHFYSGKKTDVYKQMADEPSVAEEKAFEYLQGRDGFEKYLANSGANSMPSSSVEELEKVGFQTKRMVNARIQKTVGAENIGTLQKNMGGQVKQYSEQLQKAKDVKNTAKQTAASVKNTQKPAKPMFKVNPMRGLPFTKRVAQQYNYQTTRATADGRPAVFSFSYMTGFKHTERLSYGLGAATSIGLGNNWNNIRFTFEGLGLRTYAAWQWQYGIGAYTGYERIYKYAAFVGNNESTVTLNEKPHNRKAYSEAALFGLTKAYQINSKMNGSIQLLYDIWWKEKGMKTPIVLRFATMKN